MAAHHLASDVTIFSILHEGRVPASWSELTTILNRPADEVYRNFALTNRYAFLASPLRLLPPLKGDLLIITRRPFRDKDPSTHSFDIFSSGLREPGRYIIYRAPTGEIEEEYVDEAYVQKVFYGFESLLPPPDIEAPLQRDEVIARWRMVISWTFAALMTTAIGIAHRFASRRSLGRAV